MVSALTLFGLDEMMAPYASYEVLAELIRHRFANPARDLKALLAELGLDENRADVVVKVAGRRELLRLFDELGEQAVRGQRGLSPDQPAGGRQPDGARRRGHALSRHDRHVDVGAGDL